MGACYGKKIDQSSKKNVTFSKKINNNPCLDNKKKVFILKSLDFYEEKPIFIDDLYAIIIE